MPVISSNLMADRLLLAMLLLSLVSGGGRLALDRCISTLQHQKDQADHQYACATASFETIQLAERIRNELEGWKTATPLTTPQVRTLQELPPELVLVKAHMYRRHTPVSLPDSTACSMALKGELQIVVREREPGAAVLSLPRYLENSRNRLGHDLQLYRSEAATEEPDAPSEETGPTPVHWTLWKNLSLEYLQTTARAQ